MRNMTQEEVSERDEFLNQTGDEVNIKLPPNCDSMVFIYRRKRKPHNYIVKTMTEAREFHRDDKWAETWIHTASVNAGMWIEYLLNNPRQAQEQIRSVT